MKGSGLVRPDPSFLSALPIFPVRLQTSIFGAGELNCRVRNGNGWTLALISTNSMSSGLAGEQTVLYCIWLPLSSSFHDPALSHQTVNQRSVCGLERKSSGGNELSASAGNERSRACF